MSSGNVALIALAAVALYALASRDEPRTASSGSTGGSTGGASSGSTGGSTPSDAERWIRLGIETLKTIDELFFD